MVFYTQLSALYEKKQTTKHSAGKLIYHQFIAWSSRKTHLKTEQRSIKSFHLKLWIKLGGTADERPEPTLKPEGILGMSLLVQQGELEAWCWFTPAEDVKLNFLLPFFFPHRESGLCRNKPTILPPPHPCWFQCKFSFLHRHVLLILQFLFLMRTLFFYCVCGFLNLLMTG